MSYRIRSAREEKLLDYLEFQTKGERFWAQIETWNPERKFGFLHVIAGAHLLFFHYRDVVDGTQFLAKGNWVGCTWEFDEKAERPRAKAVVVSNPESLKAEAAATDRELEVK
jgi:cold shock CspA family protein